ncbi:MAG: 16S rRNA (uracil(1498)-N(3))-methyltransferase [Clostridia bacterium]|nr:16S rRNA (uracil(1498)-N(3))-methyltransferase [Clostridia bacterium]
MARQFFVNSDDMIQDKSGIICISSSEAKHIQVLRHNVGDYIKVNGSIYEIVKMTSKDVYVKFVEKKENDSHSSINAIVYMAMLKNEMMELAVKKAVELGANEIIPFYSKNVVVKLDKEKEDKKYEKLNKIIIEAVKQCGRDDIPKLSSFKKLSEIDFSLNDVNFLAYEKESSTFKDAIYEVKGRNITSVGIIVGPEGGFESEEVNNIMKNENVKSVSLGSRILRAETATMNMLSIVLYEFEKR